MHIVYSDIMLVGLVIAAIIGLVLRYFIFRASCALVDIDPSPLKSVLVVLFALAIFLAVIVPMSLFGLAVINVTESTFLFVLWNVVGLVIVWAILGALYIPAVPVSVAKGFLLSGYEIALGLLANTLIAAVILVICAFIQIATNSGPNQGHSALPAAPPASTVASAL
jgi:hypothetical protein